MSRLQNIDALRGLSALLVVWHHLAEQFIKIPGVAEKGMFLAEIAAKYDFGRIGIVSFFLISGFVIPNSLDNTHPTPLKKFAIRRFFRLFPAYWLSLLLMTLLLVIWYRTPSTLTILANTTMLQSFFNEPHIIGLYWTLGVELVFYILCAYLFKVKMLNQPNTLLMMVIIGTTLFAVLQIHLRLNEVSFEINKEFQILPYLLAIMFLGAIYRKVYDTSNKSLRLYAAIGSLFCFLPPLILWILAVAGIQFFEEQFRFGSGHFLALCMFLIGMKTLKRPPVFLLWLGAVSYSIYLFHPIVLKLMQLKISNTTSLHGSHLGLYIFIGTVLTLILSGLIYKYLEKPMIQIGYRLSVNK
jgi:peptidoglycan/LPS O-acetylase OafA/YrhL